MDLCSGNAIRKYQVIPASFMLRQRGYVLGASSARYRHCIAWSRSNAESIFELQKQFCPKTIFFCSSPFKLLVVSVRDLLCCQA